MRPNFMNDYLRALKLKAWVFLIDSNQRMRQQNSKIWDKTSLKELWGGCL